MKNRLKQLILLHFVFTIFSLNTFGQSITILPENMTNHSDTGINYNITANSDQIGIQSNRFNGTLALKSPVTINQNILRISAGGFYSNTSSDQQASIRFVATENYNISGSGTKINFWTTPNAFVNQVERMVINHDGNVGIGQPSPTEKLDINGGLRVSNLSGIGVRNAYVNSTGVLTSTPQSRVLTVAPSTFQRRNDNTLGNFHPQGVYGDCYMSVGSTDLIVAPVQVPEGAIITGVTFYYTDTSPTSNFRFYFMKNSITTSNANILAQAFQNTTNVNTYDISNISSGTINETVNTGEYFYVIVLAVDSTNTDASSWASFMSIKGVQVNYTF